VTVQRNPDFLVAGTALRTANDSAMTPAKPLLSGIRFSVPKSNVQEYQQGRKIFALVFYF